MAGQGHDFGPVCSVGGMGFRSLGTKIQLLAGAAFLAGLGGVLAMQTYSRVEATRNEKMEANFRIVHGLAGPAAGAIAARDQNVVASYVGLLTADPRAAGVVISSGGTIIENQQSIDHFDMPLKSLNDTVLRAELTGKREVLEDSHYQFVAVPVTGTAGRRVGAIGVAWSTTGLLDTVWQAAYREALALLAVVAGVLLILLWALRSLIISPLNSIASRFDSVTSEGAEAGLPDHVEFEQRGDEIGTFARALGKFYRGTAEKHLLHQQLNSALTNMSQGLCMYDSDGRLVVWNARFKQMYALAHDEPASGWTYQRVDAALRQHEVFKSRSDDAPQLRTAAEPKLAIDETRDLEGGRTFTVSRQPIENAGWVETHTDVTELRTAEKQLTHLAGHDALTDLPNRREFRSRIDEALSSSNTDGEFAVMFLDLDKFKAVNDTMGHAAGDELLQQVAKRLSECVGPHDSVYRLGGDEFAVLQFSHQPQPVAAANLAKAMTQAILRPFHIQGRDAQIGVSVGIAISACGGETASALLQKADMAVYQAKDEGRSSYCFFTSEMSDLQRMRQRLEADLSGAVERGEFYLEYQPIVDIANGRIVSVEALARWRHPELGNIPPSTFIGIAEETGLIVKIGDWILAEACRQATTWPHDVQLSVNISAVQLRNPSLAEAVFQALATSKLSARRLVLELTESVLLHDDHATLALLHRLKEFGVLIAIDDFGVGYSALSYLTKFPVDRLKLDRGFISGLQQGNANHAIINAVASMSHSLNVRTVAEGVETDVQRALLAGAGIHEMQGYLFSPAVSGEWLSSMINKERSTSRAKSSHKATG